MDENLSAIFNLLDIMGNFSTVGKGLATTDKISSLLQGCDQMALFLKLGGVNVSEGRQFKNPFRNDKKPSCYLEYRSGILKFYDWADKDFLSVDMFNIFRILEERKGVTDITLIISKFAAFLRSNELILPGVYQRPDDLERFKFQLAWRERLWEVRDKNYWYGRYGITKTFLESEMTKPVEKYWFNTKTEPNVFKCSTPKEITYVQVINNRGKIYMPLSKHFITNQLATDIGGLSKLDYSRPLIITKSFKDYSVLSLSKYNSRYILSETVPLPQAIKDLILKFPKTIILTDNDEAGIKAAQYYQQQTSQFSNVISTVCPVSNDPAKLVEEYGKGRMLIEINNLLV